MLTKTPRNMEKTENIRPVWLYKHTFIKIILFTLPKFPAKLMRALKQTLAAYGTDQTKTMLTLTFSPH